MKKILQFDEDGNPFWAPRGAVRPRRAIPTPAVNDLALGFTSHDIAEKEVERDLGGFRGSIEFKKDPQLPWYGVQASSWSELNRYAEYLDMPDRNSTNGAGSILTADDISAAEDRVRQQYPSKVQA